MLLNVRLSMTPLADFLEHHDIRQVEVASALGVTESAVSSMLKGRFEPRKVRIDAILTFLSTRLGRPVTYEEAFLGEPIQKAS